MSKQPQTVDKVHGMRREFFRKSAINSVFIWDCGTFYGIIEVSKLGMGIAFMMTSNTERKL